LAALRGFGSSTAFLKTADRQTIAHDLLSAWNGSNKPAHSAETAELTIFKIPREMAGILARFLGRFAIEKRGAQRAPIPAAIRLLNQ
jgi:hypothetical protein